MLSFAETGPSCTIRSHLTGTRSMHGNNIPPSYCLSNRSSSLEFSTNRPRHDRLQPTYRVMTPTSNSAAIAAPYPHLSANEPRTLTDGTGGTELSPADLVSGLPSPSVGQRNHYSTPPALSIHDNGTLPSNPSTLPMPPTQLAGSEKLYPKGDLMP